MDSYDTFIYRFNRAFRNSVYSETVNIFSINYKIIRPLFCLSDIRNSFLAAEESLVVSDDLESTTTIIKSGGVYILGLDEPVRPEELWA